MVSHTWTYSNLFAMYPVLSAKQTAGIPQKCVLSGSCVFQFIFVFAMIDYGPPEYGSYLYPQWAQLLGWLTSASILAWIPGVAIYEVCRQEGGIKKVRYL